MLLQSLHSLFLHTFSLFLGLAPSPVAGTVEDDLPVLVCSSSPRLCVVDCPDCLAQSFNSATQTTLLCCPDADGLAGEIAVTSFPTADGACANLAQNDCSVVSNCELSIEYTIQFGCHAELWYEDTLTQAPVRILKGESPIVGVTREIAAACETGEGGSSNISDLIIKVYRAKREGDGMGDEVGYYHRKLECHPCNR